MSTLPHQPEEVDSPAKRDPTSDTDAISYELQRARNDAGLSIVELGRLTGISKTVLHGYERGRTKPGAREIRLLSVALNVSPNKLILGSDDFASGAPEFTSFYRKLRARPELAAVFSAMCMPLVAALLDEEEVRSLMLLVTSLLKARNPQAADQMLAAAQEAMAALNNATLPDGSMNISPEDLHALIDKTQQDFTDKQNKSKDHI